MVTFLTTSPPAKGCGYSASPAAHSIAAAQCFVKVPFYTVSEREYREDLVRAGVHF